MDKKPLLNAADLVEDLVKVNKARSSTPTTRTGQSYRCKSWPRDQYIHISRGIRGNPRLSYFLHYNITSKSDEIYKTMEGMFRDKGFTVKYVGPQGDHFDTIAEVEAKNPEEVDQFVRVIKGCLGQGGDEFQRYSPGIWLFRSVEVTNSAFYISWLIATFLIFQLISKTFELDGFWLPFFFSAPLGLISAFAIFTLVSVFSSAITGTKEEKAK